MFSNFELYFFYLQHILVSPNNEEYEMLLDDLKDRVMEHQGETIYVVGTGGKIIIQYRDVVTFWKLLTCPSQ